MGDLKNKILGNFNTLGFLEYPQAMVYLALLLVDGDGVTFSSIKPVEFNGRPCQISRTVFDACMSELQLHGLVVISSANGSKPGRKPNVFLPASDWAKTHLTDIASIVQAKQSDGVYQLICRYNWPKYGNFKNTIGVD
jgi:hypothetical protein